MTSIRKVERSNLRIELESGTDGFDGWNDGRHSIKDSIVVIDQKLHAFEKLNDSL